MESEIGQEPSLEDRVAEKYGLLDTEEQAEEETEQPEVSEDEESEEVETEESEESEAESGLEEVEFDGKVYQVPSELKGALMAKADYTRKTQELARNRENLEIHQQRIKEFQQQREFEQALQGELEQVSVLDYQIGQYKQLNWSEMGDSEIMRRRMELEQLKERREELSGHVESRRQEFSKEQEQRMNDLLSKAQEVLQRTIPGWSEDVAAEVSEYALAKGYTQQEINNVVNPRDVEMLWKAQQYDKLASTKEQALKKATKAPPVVKPGSVKPMPKDVRDELNYRKAMTKANKTGAGSQDKARLIRQRLEQKFGG